MKDDECRMWIYCEYDSLGNFWHLIVIKCVVSLNVTDSEPSQKDLLMLVAKEISDYQELGIMLGIELHQIEMIEDEKKGKAVWINMKILATWKQKAAEGTTWRTLIAALCEMDMTSVVRNIIDKLKQMQKPSS